MKLFTLILISTYLSVPPVWALTDRAKRIMGLSTEVSKDYLVLACSLLDMANDGKPTGKVVLLKQTESSTKKYTGTNLITPATFEDAKIVDFEDREFSGQVNFKEMGQKARNQRFLEIWKNARPKGKAILDLNSLGDFKFYLDQDDRKRRIVFGRSKPEFAFGLAEPGTPRLFYSCEYFVIPMKNTSPSDTQGEGCTIGRDDPGCEPAKTESDS